MTGTGRMLMRVVAAIERRYRLTAVLLVVTVVPVAVVGGAGTHAGRAQTHLGRAAALVTVLQQAVLTGHTGEARQHAAALRRETAAARKEVSGAGWRAAAHLPGIGADMAAVTAVATSLEQIAADVVPALLDVAEQLTGTTGGAVLQRLTAGPALDRAATAARQARDRVAGIDPATLLPQLRQPVRTVQHNLDRAAELVVAGLTVQQLLPAFTGAGQPRTWLVLFQNSAELRATGGMPGAWMVIRFSGGSLSMVEQGTANMMRPFDAAVLPLSPDLLALYGDRIGRYPANVNLTPDFPTAAELAAEMLRRRNGISVDGVIALDPVALSYLLRATGPVTFGAGARLSSGNAVRLLLSEAYTQVGSPAAKNDYFADAAKAVFDTVKAGHVDASAAASAVLQMAQERRLLLWSTDAAEQRLIEQLPVAGRLPLHDSSGPIVGIFLNDGSGAKLNYYLRTQVTLTDVTCAVDRRRMVRAETTFTSQVPPSGLPEYVIGLGLAGDPYTMRLNVSVFAPVGGGLVEARLDNRQIPVASGFERQRQVSMATLDIAPGTSRTLTVLLDLGTTEGDPGERSGGSTEGRQTRALTPQLWTTPTVAGWTVRTASATATGPTPVTSTC